MDKIIRATKLISKTKVLVTALRKRGFMVQCSGLCLMLDGGHERSELRDLQEVFNL